MHTAIHPDVITAQINLHMRGPHPLFKSYFMTDLPVWKQKLYLPFHSCL